jgi:hypothetical protein
MALGPPITPSFNLTLQILANLPMANPCTTICPSVRIEHLSDRVPEAVSNSTFIFETHSPFLSHKSVISTLWWHVAPLGCYKRCIFSILKPGKLRFDFVPSCCVMWLFCNVTIVAEVRTAGTIAAQATSQPQT